MLIAVFSQIAIAWIYSHILEYTIHRWWLHNRNRKHWFKDHFGNHHKLARKNWMFDYRTHNSINPAEDREVKGLGLLALLHLPIVLLFPWAYLVLAYSVIAYFVVHRRSHQDFLWARKNVPWHYDHHVGQQNMNWGVRLPWVDWIAGTRQEYKSTPKEAIRPYSNKCQEHKESSEVVREQPWSYD